MEGLLDQDDIVHYVPSFNETPLIFRNDSGENIFKSVRNDFGEDFIAGIVEGDRPEPFKTGRSFFLWDQR